MVVGHVALAHRHMNAEIGTEATAIPSWEPINTNLFAVSISSTLSLSWRPWEGEEVMSSSMMMSPEKLETIRDIDSEEDEEQLVILNNE